eukprot:6180771-Pleurochrysis_carterae.AAC.1
MDESTTACRRQHKMHSFTTNLPQAAEGCIPCSARELSSSRRSQPLCSSCAESVRSNERQDRSHR